MIKQIHHASLLTSNLDKAIQFYAEILQLPVSTGRPNLGFEGAWLEVGNQQIHLIYEESDTKMNPPSRRCGRDRHLALSVEDIDVLVERLQANNIRYERSQSGRPAIFCRDPDGNALEFIGG